MTDRPSRARRIRAALTPTPVTHAARTAIADVLVGDHHLARGLLSVLTADQLTRIIRAAGDLATHAYRAHRALHRGRDDRDATPDAHLRDQLRAAMAAVHLDHHAGGELCGQCELRVQAALPIVVAAIAQALADVAESLRTPVPDELLVLALAAAAHHAPTTDPTDLMYYSLGEADGMRRALTAVLAHQPQETDPR